MNAAIEQADLERVGPAFSPDKMLAVRTMTRDAIHAIAAAIRPGMVEEAAVEMAKEQLAERGLLRGWHDVCVRFGRNTVKTFGAPSEPGVVLGEDDIFFVDIGPVFEQWEGDGGDTYLTGANADMARCASDARALFHRVRGQWVQRGWSGQKLYEYAEAQARELGWELNLELSGHRLSDFPHAAIYEGTMLTLPFSPSSMAWVLEMHIRHPAHLFGAFFEDMLLDDSYYP
jgi:Xaa-Pro aminopeptidase